MYSATMVYVDVNNNSEQAGQINHAHLYLLLRSLMLTLMTVLVLLFLLNVANLHLIFIRLLTEQKKSEILCFYSVEISKKYVFFFF